MMFTDKEVCQNGLTPRQMVSLLDYIDHHPRQSYNYYIQESTLRRYGISRQQLTYHYDTFYKGESDIEGHTVHSINKPCLQVQVERLGPYAGRFER